MEGRRANPTTPRSARGFTLVELMISLGLLLLLSLYLTQMLVNQSRAYAVVDRVTETQQNLRGVGEILEYDLRNSAALVPEHAAVCGVDRTTDTDVLVVSDSGAVQPNSDGRIAQGADVTGGWNDWQGVETLSLATDPDSPDPMVLEAGTTTSDLAAYDTNGDGTADSDFLAGGGGGPTRNAGVIIVDANNPERGTACAILNSVDATNDTLTVDFSLGGATGAPMQLGALTGSMGPARLVAVPAHVYRIVGGDLLRDGMVLAEDIEDLQVSYFFDDDEDGEVDAPGETPGAGGSPVPPPTAP